MKPAALAVFAKTPGRTPAKTRLAATVGTEAAEAFYERSLAATAAVADTAAATGPVAVIWAVAEPEALGDPIWAGRRTVGQGTGGLGDRLHTVSFRGCWTSSPRSCWSGAIPRTTRPTDSSARPRPC